VSARLEMGGLGRQAPSDETIKSYWKVRPDQVVVNPMWLVGGSIGVSEVAGAVSPAYRVYDVMPGVHPRYIHYLLRAHPYLEQYRLLGRGDTTFDRSVGREDFEGLPVALPPLNGQKRIADFLDDQVVLLDHLEERLVRILELWSERTEASIDATLTKGRGVTSKWPRLSYLVRQITSGPRGWADFAGESGSAFIRSANLRRDSLSLRLDDLVRVEPPPSALAESSRTSVDLGDVLVGITGANSGWVSLVREPELVGGHVSQHVALIRPDHCSVRSAWLAHYLRSRTCAWQLSASEYGGTKTQLSLPDLRALRVPVSALEHQDRDLAQVEMTMHTFERLRDLRLLQVELLSERKKALITAAVTGQFDVTTARRVA
jgi:type I restriction enzyme S subunit